LAGTVEWTRPSEDGLKEIKKRSGMGKEIIFAVIIAAVLMMTLSGCSLIMFEVGSLIDSSEPDSVCVSGCPVYTLRRGTAIQVITTDGDTISGKFIGTDPELQPEYWEKTYQSQYGKRTYAPGQVQALLVRDGNDTKQVQIDEIEGISWYNKKNAKYVGLAIGGCMDALLIYGIATVEFDLDFDVPLKGGTSGP
jgi:hypothetical protein